MSKSAFFDAMQDFCQINLVFSALVNYKKSNPVIFTKSGYDKKRAANTAKPERKQGLEGMKLAWLEERLGTSVPPVTVHTGGAAQEALYAAGAAAITSNTDIYIREEVFNSGSLFEKAVLLHELTHVVQYRDEKEFRSKEDIADAEAEAEDMEVRASPHGSGNYYVEINGKLFYMNKELEQKAIDYGLRLLDEAIADAVKREDVELLRGIQAVLEED